MSDAIRPYLERIIEVVIEPFVQLLFFIAFIVFAWGIFSMIVGAGDETKRTQGKKHMMYGIIGMLIMVGALGIFAVLANTVTTIAG